MATNAMGMGLSGRQSKPQKESIQHDMAPCTAVSFRSCPQSSGNLGELAEPRLSNHVAKGGEPVQGALEAAPPPTFRRQPKSFEITWNLRLTAAIIHGIMLAGAS